MTLASFFSVLSQERLQLPWSVRWWPRVAPPVHLGLNAMALRGTRLDSDFSSYNRAFDPKSRFEEIPMESQFAGFAPDSFAFFRELARNNNKPWFDLNRERYERHVTDRLRLWVPYSQETDPSR